MIKLPSHRRCAALTFTATIVAGLALASCTTGPAPTARPAAQLGSAETVSYSRIDTALRSLLAEPSTELRDLRPITLRALKAYYAANEHTPLWIGAEGLTSRGVQLARALLKARDAGAATLQPIMSAVESRRHATSLMARAELEILLSGALLDAAVAASDPTVDARADDALRIATATNMSDTLSRALPPDPAFWTLRDAVLVYRDLAAAGVWPTVPAGPKLEPGTRDARIVAVRARLAASGELSGADVASDAYDETLQRAVERFQSRHGLAPDGVVGPGTLQALNVPIAMRIETMEANLRRLQRQGRDWGHTYVAVNIAAARYRLVRDGETVFEQVAIVGQPDWKTPEIDSQIERVELNPFWTVPTRIARLEVGPEIEKDPDYLTKHNMRKVGEFYRQDPGPGNALGKAKFLFPNGYDVYLHDTNSPRLFEREVRFLSHGCVRIPNAVDLAEHLLLQDDPEWTRERIDAAIGRGKNRSIELATPVPVHLVYDTAWVDESGEIQFRKDIYGRDADLLVAAAN
jgi:murein L,D-transpeptidase YcbB/YkuD